MRRRPRRVSRQAFFVAAEWAIWVASMREKTTRNCDRWVQAFLRCSRMTLKQLNARLATMRIQQGLFDIVVWSYCAQFVRKTSALGAHVRKLAAAPR